MDIRDCIRTRRSVRAYKEQTISTETIAELIKSGTMAATGSNQQPWGFVSIGDKQEIEDWSEKTKKHLLENLDQIPFLAQYKSWLENPKFSVFNHAPNLLVIYGNTDSHFYINDCTLAAANIMLDAHGMGIGTCWIGFAEFMLNTKEFKEKYNVPENYQLVCPLSMGYEKIELTPPERKEPLIFNI